MEAIAAIIKSKGQPTTTSTGTSGTGSSATSSSSSGSTMASGVTSGTTSSSSGPRTGVSSSSTGGKGFINWAGGGDGTSGKQQSQQQYEQFQQEFKQQLQSGSDGTSSSSSVAATSSSDAVAVSTSNQLEQSLQVTSSEAGGQSAVGSSTSGSHTSTAADTSATSTSGASKALINWQQRRLEGSSKEGNILGGDRSSNVVAADTNVNNYILYDSPDSRWFHPSGLGTEYFISDSTGTVIYYAGTACSSSSVTGVSGRGGTSVGSSKGICELTDLPPGVYNWRTTGFLQENNEDIGFQFCSVQGSISTEIIFELDCDGNCSPLSIRNLETVCQSSLVQAEAEETALSATQTTTSDTSFSSSSSSFSTTPESSYVVLEGTLHLGGLLVSDVSELSVEDTNVLRKVIAQELSEVAGRNKQPHGSSDVGAVSPDDVVISSLEGLPDSFKVTTVTAAEIGRGLFASETSTSTASATATTKSREGKSFVSSSIRLSFVVTMKLQDLGLTTRTAATNAASASSASSLTGVSAITKEQIEQLQKDLTIYLHTSMKSGIFLSKVISNAKKDGTTNLYSIQFAHLVHLHIHHNIEDELSSIAGLPEIIIVAAGVIGLVVGVVLMMRWRSFDTKSSTSTSSSGNWGMDLDLSVSSKHHQQQQQTSLPNRLPDRMYLNNIHHSDDDDGNVSSRYALRGERPTSSGTSSNVVDV